MNVETLLENVQTEDELRTVLGIVRRANEKPCVLVTLREGNQRRRYVVAREDEETLRPFVGWDEASLREYGWLWFGGQWMRSYGRVDEMYRSLDLDDVVKVEEAERSRVWGR